MHFTRTDYIINWLIKKPKNYEKNIFYVVLTPTKVSRCGNPDRYHPLIDISVCSKFQTVQVGKFSNHD